MKFQRGIGMRTCARLLGTLAALATLFVAAGCGNGGHPNLAIAPPGGSFSNSNLNGTYVFSATGVDVNGFFLSILGTVQANGSGSITGGMVDLNGLEVAPSSTAITSGTYSITVDGRGKMTLNSNTSLANSITLHFVLTSTSSGISSHGLITEFDNGLATGSGSLDLQNSGALQSSYGFEFSGVTSSGGNQLPFAVAGAFAINGAGTITSGIADINNDTISLGGTNGFAASGNVTAGSPGTSTVTTSAGTFHFHVYMVDPTHLKFIETDGVPIVTGDAFTEQASMPAGVLAYSMSGTDLSSLPMVIAGFMTSDGATHISAGFEDFNDAGIVNSPLVPAFTGSFGAVSGGRTTLTLNSIYNGANGSLSSTVTFAAYPTSGGVQLLEIDSAGITGGAAFAQTATTVASNQGYGLNLAAANANGFEEDDIAEFTLNGSTFKGLEDINDQGSLLTGATFNGILTPDPNVDGHGSAISTSNQFAFNYYVVDSSTILILETDSTQLGLGVFEQQGSTHAQVSAFARFSVATAKSRPGFKWGRQSP